MSDKPIAPCRGCNSEHAGLAPRPNTADGVTHWVFCPECGMHGPCGFGEDEAIARWNAICSDIPRAQIEALEAEMRERAEQFIKRPVDITIGRGLGLNMCADRLSSLLHPELKGEDNNER